MNSAARHKQRAENLAFIRNWNAATAPSASATAAGGDKRSGLMNAESEESAQVKRRGFRLWPNKFLDWLPEEYGSTATALRRTSSRGQLDKAIAEGKVRGWRWGGGVVGGGF
jgi:hypothetical protein